MGKKNDWRQYVGQCGPGPDPIGPSKVVKINPDLKFADELTKPKIIGIIATKKLHVRSTPEINKYNSIGTIEEDTQVLIDVESSTDDFYKILSKAGDDGYCMKKYIRLRTVTENER